jgi:hypothetical protein
LDGKFGPDLAAVISVLQTALTPAFLLVALGSLLNVLTGRLARIVDRSRDLQHQYPNTEGIAHERIVRELRIIEKRMRVVGSSILFAVLSAISVCVMIVALFVLGLTNTPAAWVAVWHCSCSRWRCYLPAWSSSSVKSGWRPMPFMCRRNISSYHWLPNQSTVSGLSPFDDKYR